MGRYRGGRSRHAMTISQPRGLALETIAEVDPGPVAAMQGERRRQHDNIELIASENYVSAAVMEAQGAGSPTSTPKAYPESAITAGASSSTSPRRWPSERALALFPARSTSTCSRTRAPRPTWLRTSACSSPATGPRDESRPWRPSHARDGAQLQREAVSRSTPTASARTPSASTTTRWKPRRARSGRR